MTELVFSTGDEIAARFEIELKKRIKNKGKLPGKASGFAGLDNLTYGYQPGLHVIAGRPGKGKTAFGLQLAFTVAQRDRIPVGMLSLEMSEWELWLRLMSNLCEIDGGNIQCGNLTEEELVVITTTSRMVASVPLFVAEARAGINTVPAIKNQIDFFRNEMPEELGLVLIDQLQKMKAVDVLHQDQNEIAKFTEITGDLHELAMAEGIPLVLLCQMNRLIEGRAVKRPNLGDLKGCGSIEQDATTVTFVHDPEDEQDKELRQLILAKNRHGKIGDVDVTFSGPFTRFYEKDANPQSNFQPPKPKYKPAGSAWVPND